MQPLDAFLAATADRIPTVQEMLDLCAALNIRISMRDGQPVTVTKPETRAEAELLTKLFRREPFRSQAIAAAKLETK